MYTVFFEDVALRDLEVAKQYYRNVNDTVSERFQDELEKAVQLLIANPLMFQKRIGDSRFLRVQHFPYVIVYVVEEKTVIVDAVFCTIQDPQRLGDRM